MSRLTLVLREVRHRWGTFVLSVAAVAVAVGVVVASELWLLRDRQETEAILAAKRRQVEATIAARQAEVERTGAELQDAIRKHMTKLGFNILVLPQEQDLAELHLNGTLTSTMPESYAQKLADSGVVTVNHLLPLVTRRLKWPERDIEVVLVGTRGEIPILHRSEKQPLLAAVAPGDMVIGAAVQRQLGVQVEDSVTFLGREFTIRKINPDRGTVDDVTVWIDLATAQELLGLQNLIHGILALECECTGDRITQVRAELQGILPGTQVIERYSQALARAEARNQARLTAERALAEAQASGRELLEQEARTRQAIEDQHAQLAAWLAPTVVLAAAAWVAFLTWLNVRQRRVEIGILRAIGLPQWDLLLVFLAKAALVGVIGGVAGLLLGTGLTFWSRPAAALLASDASSPAGWPAVLWLAPLAAPLLAAAASWLPALAAAHQDPAAVLEGE
jgi:hypothetical protein